MEGAFFMETQELVRLWLPQDVTKTQHFKGGWKVFYSVVGYPARNIMSPGVTCIEKLKLLLMSTVRVLFVCSLFAHHGTAGIYCEVSLGVLFQAALKK